jgi:hypothetical protein
LSESTERFDRGKKFDSCRTIPSLQAYLMVTQDAPHLILYVRQPDQQWLLSEARALDDTLSIPPIDCRLSLADVYNKVLLEMSLLDHEQMRVMLLDARNQVQSISTVYKGSVNIAHNHPSGDPTPSRNDIRVTKDLVAAGELLGIAVLDHVVIGGQKFVSMKERGLGF